MIASLAYSKKHSVLFMNVLKYVLIKMTLASSSLLLIAVIRI